MISLWILLLLRHHDRTTLTLKRLIWPTLYNERTAATIPCHHAKMLMELPKTMMIRMHSMVFMVTIVALRIWIASDESECSAIVLKQDV